MSIGLDSMNIFYSVRIRMHNMDFGEDSYAHIYRFRCCGVHIGGLEIQLVQLYAAYAC